LPRPDTQVNTERDARNLWSRLSPTQSTVISTCTHLALPGCSTQDTAVTFLPHTVLFPGSCFLGPAPSCSFLLRALSCFLLPACCFLLAVSCFLFPASVSRNQAVGSRTQGTGHTLRAIVKASAHTVQPGMVPSQTLSSSQFNAGYYGQHAYSPCLWIVMPPHTGPPGTGPSQTMFSSQPNPAYGGQHVYAPRAPRMRDAGHGSHLACGWSSFRTHTVQQGMGVSQATSSIQPNTVYSSGKQQPGRKPGRQ
jgi:hypothetical protein